MSLIKTAKQDARILKAYLKKQGITLPQSHALEAIARLAHHRNWATLVGASKAASRLAPAFASIASWPLFVFSIDEDEETLKEVIYVLPAGTLLEDDSRYSPYGILQDEDSRPVPQGCARAALVVTSVYSVLPRIDKYGLPSYADESRAAGFFREYGFAAIEEPEVNFRDLGDDSASRIWFEARVHPDTAKMLEQIQR